MALALRLGYAASDDVLRSSRQLVDGLQRAKRRQLTAPISVAIAAGILVLHFIA